MVTWSKTITDTSVTNNNKKKEGVRGGRKEQKGKEGMEEIVRKRERGWRGG